MRSTMGGALNKCRENSEVGIQILSDMKLETLEG